MPADLYYLALSAGLCAVLWIPYIVGVLAKFGANPDDYRDLPNHPLTPFLKRAYRAHVNLVENLPIFASLVLVAHLGNKANDITALAAAIFFWSRLAHAIVFWGGWPYVRTLAFAVSWLAMIAILWQILA